MRWWEGPAVGFDIESTHADPTVARPVSFAFALVAPAQPIKVDRQLVNPDMPIPQEAIDIHGITDDDVADAQPLIDAIEYMVAKIRRLSGDGLPIATMNGSYDMTVIDLQAERLGVEGMKGWPGALLDLFVLDKHVDKWRRGSRKLDAMCSHYGVVPEDLHDATSDAVGAVLCVQALARQYREIGSKELGDLHQLQAKWRREQQEDLSDYFVKKGDPAISAAEMNWPVQGEMDSTDD